MLWAFYKKRLRTLLFLPLLLFLVFGYGRFLWQERGYDSLSHVLVDQRAEYLLEIDSEGQYFTGGEEPTVRYIGRVQEIKYEDAELRHGVAGVYVYLPNPQENHFYIGDKIRVSGVVRPFRYYKNPGHINLEYRRKSEELIGNLYPDKNMDVERISLGDGFSKKIQVMREEITQFFRMGLPEEEAMLVKSLLFGGNYDSLNPQVVADFATTGIIHILSVSGSHIALLFGVLFFCGRCLGIHRYAQFIISILLVLFYATLAGWVPPVTRSFVMGSAAMGAMVLRRDFNGMHWLGIAVCAMLLVNPYLLADVSFQLSVGATAGILLFYRPVQEFFCRHCGLPKNVAALIAVSVAAQILLLPFLLYYFHSLPIYAVLGNLLVAPMLEWVIIGGLSAILLSIIWQPMGVGVLYFIHFIVYLAVWLNAVLAGLPGASYYYRGLKWWEIIFYYGVVLTLAILPSYRGFIEQHKGQLMTAFMALALVYGGLWCWDRFGYSWQVLVPDVGYSRMVVIENGEQFLLYYKEGVYASATDFREAVSVLEYYGIRQVDLCIYAPGTKKGMYALPVNAKQVVVGAPINNMVFMPSGQSVLPIVVKNGKFNLANGMRLAFYGGNLTLYNRNTGLIIKEQIDRNLSRRSLASSGMVSFLADDNAVVGVVLPPRRFRRADNELMELGDRYRGDGVPVFSMEDDGAIWAKAKEQSWDFISVEGNNG